MLPIIGNADTSFNQQTYLGIGLGMTQFAPTGANGAELQLLDDQAATAQIVLGRDFSPRLSGELSYLNLGSASLTPTTEIEYEDISLSGLIYFSNAKNSRNGLAAFTRLGIGQIETKGDTIVSRDHPVHLLAGAGIEYMSNSGLGVRTEFTYLDKDAQSATINLLYRFSSSQQLAEPPRTVSSVVLPEAPRTVSPVALPEAPVATQPVTTTIDEPPRILDIVADKNVDGNQALTADYNSLPEAATIPELPAIEPVSTDSQLATVTFSEYPQTSDLNLPVDPVGTQPDATAITSKEPTDDRSTDDDLSLVDLSSLAPQTDASTPVLESLVFPIRSSELSKESIQALDQIATTMQLQPELTLSVYAHTDNRGNPENNLALSKQRAVSVARYLTRNGIDISRINAIAYGGSQPIATNDTIDGRRSNRRVELEYTR